MKLKMKMKSVSSLMLLAGALAYAAMQIGVSGPAAADGPPQRSAPAQRIVRKEPPRQEKAAPRHPQVYFATA